MNLKIARQIARLTQRQLAARAGVDEATISLLERGERDYAQAGYAAVVRLARALQRRPGAAVSGGGGDGEKERRSVGNSEDAPRRSVTCDATLTRTRQWRAHAC